MKESGTASGIILLKVGNSLKLAAAAAAAQSIPFRSLGLGL
jgi:hypothetical protein